MKNFIYFFLFLLVCITSCVEIPDSPETTVNEQKNKAASKLSNNSKLSNDDVEKVMKIKNNAYGKEQMFTEASQANFNKVQSPTTLSWSLERDNIDKRNHTWNDPNKIGYVYLLSDMGTIISYFPIKGKVSSVNSKLTNTMQVVYKKVNAYDDYAVTGTVESPSMDGSYGTNGDAVFFFLTDGTYMEWSGKYLLCDNYVKLTQKPVLTYNIK